MKRRGARLLGVCCLLALMTACGESKDKAATQTAAKVNGDEITVHQINAELQRRVRGNVPEGEKAEAASKQILESLVDQTLLVQQAKEAKLDRDPQVLQALEAARRQILAQAYIDRQVAATPPSQDEIKAFYEKHPDLFQRRRIYAFREFVFERSHWNEDLRKELNDAKGPADVSRILTAAGIKFREANSMRAAESLPLEALPKIAQMAKGDTIAFTDQNVANVLMLMDYREQPIPFDRATSLIQQYLVNQKKREFAQNRVKELRAKADIEYLGQFAKSGEGAAKAADVKVPDAVPAPVKDQVDHIEKGISGMAR